MGTLTPGGSSSHLRVGSLSPSLRVQFLTHFSAQELRPDERQGLKMLLLIPVLEPYCEAQVSVDQELAITVSWEDTVLPGFTRLFTFSDHLYFPSLPFSNGKINLSVTGHHYRSWEDS